MNPYKIDPHRIVFGSQGGQYEIGNLIGLCRLVAHKAAHEGRKVDGKRLSAKQYIIYVLEQWLDDLCWRWEIVYNKLKGGK